MVRNLLYCAVFMGLVMGCKQKDLTPSWVKIDSFSFSTVIESQGPNSHNIVDAWVFMDNKSLGVFEMPCKIPVLAEGEHKFVIFPGIKNNGISDTRVRYPFYTSYEITANLTKNDTLELFPSTAYKTTVSIPFLEDFESAGINFEKGTSSDTNIVFVEKLDFPEIVKYGDNCGAIFLNDPDSVYTGSTNTSLYIPKGKKMYMELDYLNNNSLAVGLIARYPDGSISTHTPLLIVNPQKEGEEVWKKIYIDFTEDVGFEKTAVSFEVYFIAQRDPDISVGNIYIDNVKVVYN